MKIRLNTQRQRQSGVTIWLVLIVLVVSLVIIGIFAYLSVKTIKKIVPAPPPDQDGYVPGIGDPYMNGIITGYTNSPPPGNEAGYPVTPNTTALSNVTVLIYASDVPYPGTRLDLWTNLIWTGTMADVTNITGSNGLPIEQWTNGQQPPARFYNWCISTNQ